jgi:hypothetical protein
MTGMLVLVSRTIRRTSFLRLLRYERVMGKVGIGIGIISLRRISAPLALIMFYHAGHGLSKHVRAILLAFVYCGSLLAVYMTVAIVLHKQNTLCY